MILNYIIIEEELHRSHLPLIVTKNNSFLCIIGEVVSDTCIFVFVPQFAEATFSIFSMVFVFLVHISPN